MKTDLRLQISERLFVIGYFIFVIGLFNLHYSRAYIPFLQNSNYLLNNWWDCLYGKIQSARSRGIERPQGRLHEGPRGLYFLYKLVGLSIQKNTKRKVLRYRAIAGTSIRRTEGFIFFV